MPATDKDILLAALLEERPAVLRKLIGAWIETRDQHNRRPYESKECVKAKESYRRANDVVERFFDEYLVKDPNGHISYSDLKAAWQEFTGDAKPNMRDLVNTLTDRFRFTTRDRSNGERVLKGARKRTEFDPDSDENPDVVPQVTQNQDFHSEDGKSKKVNYGTENAILGHSGHSGESAGGLDL